MIGDLVIETKDLTKKFKKVNAVNQLSLTVPRGMAMKVALLSSLAYRPELLVLDEPFTGLDPLVRDEFIQGILDISKGEEWSIFICLAKSNREQRSKNSHMDGSK